MSSKNKDTIKVTLTPKQREFLEEAVAKRNYPDLETAIQKAVDLLMADPLREKLRIGTDEHGNDQYMDLTDEELENFLNLGNVLGPRPRRRR